MLLRSAHDAVLVHLEVEECDQVIRHELGGYWTADERGEFRRTERESCSICTTLSLSLPPFA
jgi:hypothetical protein